MPSARAGLRLVKATKKKAAAPATSTGQSMPAASGHSKASGMETANIAALRCSGVAPVRSPHSPCISTPATTSSSQKSSPPASSAPSASAMSATPTMLRVRSSLAMDHKPPKRRSLMRKASSAAASARPSKSGQSMSVK